MMIDIRDDRKKSVDLAKIDIGLAFSILLYMYGFFAFGANAAKYIGMLLAIILFFVSVLLDSRKVFSEMRRTLNQEKILSIMILVALLVMVFSTYLNYPLGINALLRYQGPVISIGAIILSLPREQKEFLLRGFFIIAPVALAYGLYNYGWATYWHYHVHHRFDRDSNVFTVLLLPFLMAYVFINRRKNKLWISIVIGIIVSLLATSLWTGERGAWGSILIEVLILAWVLAREKYLSSKRFLQVFIMGTILALATGMFLYKINANFKHQVDRGLGLNGRGLIVKTRFPLFLSSDKIALGFGYSDKAYNDFFNEKKAPHVYGKMQDGSYHFYQDGPFYMQLFYHFGFIGLGVFLIYTCWFIYRAYRLHVEGVGELNKIFYAALLSSFVGYFIIGGLVENRTIYYMFFMYFLLITASAGLDRNQVT